MARNTRNTRDSRGGRRRDNVPREESEIQEKLVHINRVAKVVKGGRRFGFSALVIVGDGKGRVGHGSGKAREVPEAIRKGAAIARREMFSVPLKAGTLPHQYTSDFGAAKVLMKPASHGTGVIAGGAVRAIMEAAGVTDVLTKSLGSRNPVNVARATVKGLAALRDPDVARDRRFQIIAEASGEAT